MDLGIAGKTALVCASSQGLGRACATELARAGCRVMINGRDPEALEAAAAAIRAETGAEVIAVAADISTEAGRAALLAAAPEPDILVNNNGGPPPRPFQALDGPAIHAGLEANMVAPALLVQAVLDGMVERRFGRIVCITSGSVKLPIPGLDLSSGARIGLHGFLAGLARTVAGANVTINFLLPGSFETRRIESLYKTTAAREGISEDQAQANAVAQIPAGRLGSPHEFGAACAFLCSAQAGYITGQSLLIDGGRYPAVF